MVACRGFAHGRNAGLCGGPAAIMARMSDPVRDQLRRTLVEQIAPAFRPGASLAQQRQVLDSMGAAAQLPAGVTIDRGELAGLPTEWLSAPGWSADHLLLHLHGGGYVMGSCASHRALTAQIAAACGIRAVLPEYRLAPEHPFPAAIDDCVAATRAVLAKASELGVDPERVAVGGDSAGGNLALNVAQVVPEVRAQLVLYPTTDVDLDTPSKRRFATGFGLDRTTVDWFTERYLGHSNHADPRASPLGSTTLDRCPRTIVVLAGFDVLRDEGQRFVERLESAGVRTTSRVEGAMIHGFIHLTRIASCDAATARLVRDVRDLLHA